MPRFLVYYYFRRNQTQDQIVVDSDQIMGDLEQNLEETIAKRLLTTVRNIAISHYKAIAN